MAAKFGSSYLYQPGGSLAPDAPTYVVRQADREFYQALMAREYCYVLNARQMGKSSLRLRTMKRLGQQGIACADIELSGIGSQQITAPQWYGGMIQELISGFALTLDRRPWLQQYEDLSPIQRLAQFIETILLEQIPQPIVIFIDEIDSVLGLSFPTDEFFSFIRNCYDKRALKPKFRRLTFALLGVATPSDLIQNKYFSTPFNIGRAITLKGFTLEECAPLIQGLKTSIDHPDLVLAEILNWTGGQPFLTQKLCWLVAHMVERESGLGAFDSPAGMTAREVRKIPVDQIQAFVSQIVYTQILHDWEGQDDPEHLRTIRDRLLRYAAVRIDVLITYQEILKQGKLPLFRCSNYLDLCLTGAVELNQSYLQVKNPIYGAIFDLLWVEQHLHRLRGTLKISSDAAIVVSTAAANPLDVTILASAPENYRVRQILAGMSQQCRLYGGQVLRFLDQGLLLSFQTATQAMQWAIAVQKQMALMPAWSAQQVNYRIGIHMGPLFYDGQDVVGAGIDLAVGLQQRALPGGICFSQEIYYRIERLSIRAMATLARQTIEDLPDPVNYYQISPGALFTAAAPTLSWGRRWLIAGLAGLIGAGAVLGSRWLGWLQPWELQSFDQLMRLRPGEPSDNRLLLVTITEADVQFQRPDERGGASLSDRALLQLLDRLNQGQPRAIALDIYREQQPGPQYPRLQQALTHNPRLFTICNYGNPGVLPPPDVPPDRQGFNNVIEDPDGVIRRQILAVGNASPCQSPFSINWVVATRYLADEGIYPVAAPDRLQLGDVAFPRLQPRTGGYNQIDTRGQQILLNYRAAAQIAPAVTLQQVLADSFDPTIVKDRVVLVGTVAPSFNDTKWVTPYSPRQWRAQTITGVEMQAQMTSQILSAALDGRRLIWSWSELGEAAWIVAWALGAGLLMVPVRSRWRLGLGLGGGWILIGGVSWVMICIGGWIPGLPAALAFTLSGVLGYGLGQRWLWLVLSTPRLPWRSPDPDPDDAIPDVPNQAD